MDNASAFKNDDSVEHALELLDQAISLLDSENLEIAAAKVDDARNALLESACKTRGNDPVIPVITHCSSPSGSQH